MCSARELSNTLCKFVVLIVWCEGIVKRSLYAGGT